MLKYSLIEDGRGNYRYETHEEQERSPEPDQKSTLRALLQDVDRMTMDELKAKITAILPGAIFEVDSFGGLVIRANCRLHVDPESLTEALREKARDFVPPKRGLFGKRK